MPWFKRRLDALSNRGDFLVFGKAKKSSDGKQITQWPLALSRTEMRLACQLTPGANERVAPRWTGFTPVLRSRRVMNTFDQSGKSSDSRLPDQVDLNASKLLMLVDAPRSTLISTGLNGIWRRGGSGGMGCTTVYCAIRFLLPNWRPGRRRWRWGLSGSNRSGGKSRMVIEPVPSGRLRHLPPAAATARADMVPTTPGDPGVAQALALLLHLGQQRRDRE